MRKTGGSASRFFKDQYDEKPNYIRTSCLYSSSLLYVRVFLPKDSG